jgi:DMSO/TMAO reductase YedYZ molybdopterin-dependent catalytic subunit
MHYLLIHFDIPFVTSEAAARWTLDIGGKVARPVRFSLGDLQAMPAVTHRVTLECAGNGRALAHPRWQSQPWEYGAVGTAEWTGTPLAGLLERAGVDSDAVEIAFFGADRGFDGGVEHDYGRSLTPAIARNRDIIVAWAMNGQPLLPQHGYPLRLVVPGWYGMASVKWLNRIEALDRPFDGYQQTGTYIYKQHGDDPGTPVTTMRVKSLLVPPGIPDWFTRRRLVDAGEIEVFGRAWSGAGGAISRVEFAADGVWQDATLDPAPPGPYAWRGWRARWRAKPGEHVLSCRATDANGDVQPLEQRWDNAGFGNNMVQRVAVTVR